MKVAYVLMQFPVPSETFACTEVRALKRLGVDVSVYGLRSAHVAGPRMLERRGCADIPVAHAGLGGFFSGVLSMVVQPWLTIQALRVIFRACHHRLSDLVKSLALLPASFFVWNKLRGDPPDVVHLFWGHYPSIVGWLVKRGMPKVKLSMFLGAYDLEMSYPLSREVLLVADFVFTHAAINVAAIHALVEVPVSVVHRGVDCELLRSVPDADKIPGRMLVAGRLIAAKRIDRVIDICKAVSASSLSASLVIAGDGPERAALERQILEQGLQGMVSCVGHIDQEELFSEMKKAEFFLFPSEHKSERLPNSLKEAMFLGCICVASRTPGIAELIENEATGFLVDSKNTEAVVQIIEDVVRDPERTRALRRRARLAIEERFDVRRLVVQYVTRWKSFCRN